MKTLIEIILVLVALYCGSQWGRILYYQLSGSLLTSEFDQYNDYAYKFGTCAILALGFLGVML